MTSKYCFDCTPPVQQQHEEDRLFVKQEMLKRFQLTNAIFDQKIYFEVADADAAAAAPLPPPPPPPPKYIELVRPGKQTIELRSVSSSSSSSSPPEQKQQKHDIKWYPWPRR